MKYVSRVVPPTMRAYLPGLAIMLLALVVLMGCGPVQSTSRIGSAEAALERARVNDAEELSPYEFHRAQLYLYKAKQEWGYSNFEAARDYADEALRAARAARDNSLEAPWAGHPILGRNATPEDVAALSEEQLDRFDDDLD